MYSDSVYDAMVIIANAIIAGFEAWTYICALANANNSSTTKQKEERT